MPVEFNFVNENHRIPGTQIEIDNSRALQNLVQNPHKVLIIGQKTSSGTKSALEIIPVNNDNVADTYFGPGSILARTVNKFKYNNPYTEVDAIIVADGGGATAATGSITFTSAATASGTLYFLINGTAVNVAVISGDAVGDLATNTAAAINADLSLPVTASATLGVVTVTAKNLGLAANYIDMRINYYTGQETPTGVALSIVQLSGGTVNPDLSTLWTVIDGKQYHHIVNPYTDTTNLVSLEAELASRFQPPEDLQGYSYSAVKDTQANLTTFGNGRNSPHQTIVGYDDAPNAPEEWAAAWAGVASASLGGGPANVGRPLHGLELKGILPPVLSKRFSYLERNTLLFDGIATWKVNDDGSVRIERSITTYQLNSVNIPDPSYLDIQTPFILGELRYQTNVRLSNRFIATRKKLADDGSLAASAPNTVTPGVIKSEIIGLFTELARVGLIENIEQFKEDLIVERSAVDVNAVNILLPPDLINQLRKLNINLQFRL